MNVRSTHNFFAKHNIVALKADKSKSPEVEEQLVELGNSQKAIPFYAIYAPGLKEPVTFSGLITSGGVIAELEKLNTAKLPTPTAKKKTGSQPLIALAAGQN